MIVSVFDLHQRPCRSGFITEIDKEGQLVNFIGGSLESP